MPVKICALVWNFDQARQFCSGPTFWRGGQRGTRHRYNIVTLQNLEAKSACLDLGHAGLRNDARPVISVTRRQSILFVTSEIADYVKAGGLGEVSAALPRALRHHCGVRILRPRCRQLLSQVGPVEQIATLPSSFGIPACGLGRATTRDGLTIYVLLCPELYDREGAPSGDARAPRCPHPAAFRPAGSVARPRGTV